ncbi:siderophore-interacting protein [Kytococcus sedentarius]|uniref:siderophore-interacting protein n=1 Tax=Kytococcus sedentarius TaxID=1276 RepID=UPI0035BBC13E
MRKGWQGAVLKVYGAKDFQVEVLDVQPVTERFVRVRARGPELLAATEWHPTMWVRLWFTDDHGKPHQRAYTVIDPQPDGTFSMDVHVHDGPAARALAGAQPGQVLDATLQGSRFTVPEGAVEHLHLVGDAASIPAIRTVLDAMPHTPATVWLEEQEPSESRIPVTERADVDVRRIERGSEAEGNLGLVLVEHTTGDWAARAHNGEDLSQHWFWLAPEASACRILSRFLRQEVQVPKERITALAYWRAA